MIIIAQRREEWRTKTMHSTEIKLALIHPRLLLIKVLITIPGTTTKKITQNIIRNNKGPGLVLLSGLRASL